MKLILIGDAVNQEVEAELFDMPETKACDRFAVHRSIGMDATSRGKFAASHVESGLAIAFGDTPEQAIKAARTAWTSRTQAQRDEALFYASAIKDMRSGGPVVRNGQ